MDWNQIEMKNGKQSFNNQLKNAKTNNQIYLTA